VHLRISYPVECAEAQLQVAWLRANPRKFAQLTALRKSRFAPILLLEGDPLRVGYSQMHPESIRGALTYITAILHVPILPSRGPSDSARLIYAAAKQCQTGKVYVRVVYVRYN
jgi:ERCC4-type nuclease